MKTNKLSILQVICSWLLFVAVGVSVLDGHSYFVDSEVEDSIEYEKEYESEKELELFSLDFTPFIDESNSYGHLVSLQIHACEVELADRSPERLYLLYQQFKTHLS